MEPRIEKWLTCLCQSIWQIVLFYFFLRSNRTPKGQKGKGKGVEVVEEEGGGWDKDRDSSGGRVGGRQRRKNWTQPKTELVTDSRPGFGTV